MGFLDTDFHRIDPAHLSCTHADRAAVVRENDRIRFHVLHHAPGEIEVSGFSFRRLSLRHDVGLRAEQNAIGFLQQHTARDGLHFELFVKPEIVSERDETQVRLRRENLYCVRIEIRRNDGLDKELHRFFRCGPVHVSIETNDRSKSGKRIRLIGL